jgi:2-polyprenyl-6-methoxyphenol hydroxylase-like FAD-dependent oxidoreductase
MADYNGFCALASKLRHIESLLLFSPVAWQAPVLPACNLHAKGHSSTVDATPEPNACNSLNEVRDASSMPLVGALRVDLRRSPPVIIIGGGIGGLAAALALQMRGIHCIVYERDAGWHGHKRGYGLTLSNVTALAELGLEQAVRAINQTCISDCHWVFHACGEVLGYFGTAFSGKNSGKRGNLRVPRHVLRRMIYERLLPGTVRWGWSLVRFEEDADGSSVTAHLRRVEPAANPTASQQIARAAVPPETLNGSNGDSDATTESVQGRLLVGADGVWSSVRRQKFGAELRSLGVVLVMGISTLHHKLLHEQGFYTVDGTHRLFTMPFEPIEVSCGPVKHTTMWQLSFAMADDVAARALCASGGAAILAEIKTRCATWHAPVLQMMEETRPDTVWGTILFDRPAMPLRQRQNQNGTSPYRSRVLVMGDAAHAMTPFKGQGANQALADAALLGKRLAPVLLAEDAATAGYHPVRLFSSLAVFEAEMSQRAEAKVVASRDAALLYHSAAAVDPQSYGIVGLAPEDSDRLLTALRDQRITAITDELELKAVAVHLDYSTTTAKTEKDSRVARAQLFGQRNGEPASISVN